MRRLLSIAVLPFVIATGSAALAADDPAAVLALLAKPPSILQATPFEPAAYTGPCGGTVRDCDSDQTQYECDADERPICGECGTCDCYSRSECR